MGEQERNEEGAIMLNRLTSFFFFFKLLEICLRGNTVFNTLVENQRNWLHFNV